MSVLSADFEKRFQRGPQIRAVFEQPADRFSVTVLFGPSGCGKTTILRCLAGLERPELGRISFGPEHWFNASSKVFARPQQRGVGFLFQDYALFPHMTVAGNIGYSLRSMPTDDRRHRIGDLLDMLQLTGLEGRYPRQLSGGEQQRVALARAVAMRPRLLLLDEPLSALDSTTREELRRHLRQLLASFAIPSFVVTHDRWEALALGDYVTVLDRGTVKQSGPVSEVFSQPADAQIAKLVGVETVVPARVVRVEEGLAILQVISTSRERQPPELVAVAPSPLKGDVQVCIRGEDVTIQKGAVEHTSARNRLVGRISSLAAEGPLIRAELDCGFPLVALITKNAAAELGLREGDAVTAVVKAPAIHVIDRP
jgi:molybdate transport system ATP-binding protein